LTWRERGGPLVRNPGATRTSLGTELVKGFAANELGGRCEMTYSEAGAEHWLEFTVRTDDDLAGAATGSGSVNS
jgi:two-component sensor histidine kinase